MPAPSATGTARKQKQKQNLSLQTSQTQTSYNSSSSTLSISPQTPKTGSHLKHSYAMDDLLPTPPPPSDPLPLPPIDTRPTAITAPVSLFPHSSYRHSRSTSIKPSKPSRTTSTTVSTTSSPRRSVARSSPPLPPAPRSSGAARRHMPSHSNDSTPQIEPINCARSPEQYLREIRDRTEQQFLRQVKPRPSVPELDSGVVSSNISNNTDPRSDSTKSVPAVPQSSSITTFGRSHHNIAIAPVVPTLSSKFKEGDAGRFPTASSNGLTAFSLFGRTDMKEKYADLPKWEMGDTANLGPSGFGGGGGAMLDLNSHSNLRIRTAVGSSSWRRRRAGQKCINNIKHRFRKIVDNFGCNFPLNLLGGDKNSEAGFDSAESSPPRSRTDMTIRIKNNSIGNCLFEIRTGRSGDIDDEVLIPIENLKRMFPYDKPLTKTLVEWNQHYQTPPAHWIINFIPRAYLRRGYYLAEEICEYLAAHPDGCRYRIEYEPIGHQWCLVGTVVPKPKKIRHRNSILWWESHSEEDGVML